MFCTERKMVLSHIPFNYLSKARNFHNLLGKLSRCILHYFKLFVNKIPAEITVNNKKIITFTQNETLYLQCKIAAHV